MALTSTQISAACLQSLRTLLSLDLRHMVTFPKVSHFCSIVFKNLKLSTALGQATQTTTQTACCGLGNDHLRSHMQRPESEESEIGDEELSLLKPLLRTHLGNENLKMKENHQALILSYSSETQFLHLQCKCNQLWWL